MICMEKPKDSKQAIPADPYPKLIDHYPISCFYCSEHTNLQHQLQLIFFCSAAEEATKKLLLAN